ncbi:MAG: ammonium transporter [Candidatus Brocadiales bacterium]
MVDVLARDILLVVFMLWLVTIGLLVFFMQAGFAFLEGGQVRSKNATHVYMKMCTNIAVGTLVWWIFGYAIFSGNWQYCMLGVQDPANADWLNTFGHWYSMWGFCLVSCAIASGSITERFTFAGYIIYVVIYCGLVYPFFGWIAWSAGPLLQWGYIDYAGSVVVHFQGGLFALVAAMIVGPRIGKYSKLKKCGWLFEFGAGECKPIAGHNVAQMMLGVFILCVCFYAFNVGSILIGSLCDPSVEATAKSIIAVFVADLPTTTINTTMAMAGGIFGAMFGGWLINGKSDPLSTGNGAIAGLVGVCSGVAFMHPGFAYLLGVVCGAVIPLVVKSLDKVGIDDAVGTCGVHCTAGAIGGIATGIMGLIRPTYHGVTCDMGVQALGFIMCIGYACTCAVIVFGGFKAIGLARVSEQEEATGLDLVEHKTPTYPEFIVH